MADVSWSDISSLIPGIYDGAMMHAQKNFFMPTLVRVWNDNQTMSARKGSTHSAGTVAVGLAETDDLDSFQETMTPSLEYTLTPQEIGIQYLMTDQRLTNQYNDEIADAQFRIGYSAFAQVESHLLAHFSSFTGGTIGSAGGTLTWGSVYDAIAILRATGVPAPYFVVLHEYHYRRLAQQANIAGLSNAAPLEIRNGIQTNYLVQNIGGGAYLYTTGVPTAGTAVYGGVFSRAALGFDVRRGLRIEPERNGSLRATELNATMIYAHGVTRAAYGVTLIGNASTPS